MAASLRWMVRGSFVLLSGNRMSSPLPVDVPPLNGGDLAGAGAGEQRKPQARRPERADLPFPLGLLDRFRRGAHFGFAQEAFACLLAVHLDAAGRIAAGGRSRA